MATRLVSLGTGLLFLAIAAASGHSAWQGTPLQRAAPAPSTALKPAPPPAPQITAWGPKEKVPAGEILWFQGTNLRPDLFVATFGDRAVLPHLYFELLPERSTSSRIEVRTTMAMKTGPTASTPLRVLHRGGSPVQLDPDYHIIDRNAHYSGISKWHQGETAGGSIFTEGNVQIMLNNVDFATEGTGTYAEQVRQIGLVRKTTKPCPPPNPLTITYSYWDWMQKDVPTKAIRWKRDPVAPNGILLYGIGATTTVNANALLLSTERLEVSFLTHVGAFGPHTDQSGDCKLHPVAPPGVYVPPPPLRPAPPSFVTYSLRRSN